MSPRPWPGSPPPPRCSARQAPRLQRPARRAVPPTAAPGIPELRAAVALAEEAVRAEAVLLRAHAVAQAKDRRGRAHHRTRHQAVRRRVRRQHRHRHHGTSPRRRMVLGSTRLGRRPLLPFLLPHRRRFRISDGTRPDRHHNRYPVVRRARRPVAADQRSSSTTASTRAPSRQRLRRRQRLLRRRRCCDAANRRCVPLTMRCGRSPPRARRTSRPSKRTGTSNGERDTSDGCFNR